MGILSLPASLAQGVKALVNGVKSVVDVVVYKSLAHLDDGVARFERTRLGKTKFGHLLGETAKFNEHAVGGALEGFTGAAVGTADTALGLLDGTTEKRAVEFAKGVAAYGTSLAKD